VKPLVLRGKVVPGAGLGRRLGFPTANVVIPPGRLPPYGVYRAEAAWGRCCLPAVCNVGVRPTLGPSGEAWLEVHVLGFDGDLYGQELEVRLLEKIRDEKRFDSLTELMDQIRKDAEAVRKAGLGPRQR
jgi:riboflavin kinase/FMN adenylyltransferase